MFDTTVFEDYSAQLSQEDMCFLNEIIFFYCNLILDSKDRFVAFGLSVWLVDHNKSHGKTTQQI